MNTNAQPQDTRPDRSASGGMRESSGIIGAEQRRAALRQSLMKAPGDNAMFEALARLTTSKHITRAARVGVFINYTRSDELFAIEVATELEAAGVAVWLDSLHMDEIYDWDSQVEAALRDCGVMVAILSPEALQDDAATRERQKAIYSGKLVIPAIGQNVTLHNQPFFAPEIDFSDDFERGMRQLRHLLSAAPAAV